eukprot:m.154876 g.154876  ORF g.154876 m.154876 type:complete len:493 (+) comp14302_c0_seq1:64-1542(+)
MAHQSHGVEALPVVTVHCQRTGCDACASAEGGFIGVGLMSGTSCDAVDAAALRFVQIAPSSLHVTLLAYLERSINPSTQSAIKQLVEMPMNHADVPAEPPPKAPKHAKPTLVQKDEGGCERRAALTIGDEDGASTTAAAVFAPDATMNAASATPIAAISRLHVSLGHAFAAAALQVIERAGLKPSDVDWIGSHGQTVFHGPNETPGHSLQIGSAAVIAKETGCLVVSDFRAADVARGGQGAPILPFVDYWLHGTHDHVDGLAIVNVGGIANVTVLPYGEPMEAMQAFDVGPGNMLIDSAMRMFSDGILTYDKNGAWAKEGTVCADLLDALLSHPFCARPAPKSTGREEFGLPYLQAVLAEPRSSTPSQKDVVATLTMFTARCIADQVSKLCKNGPGQVWISGGGARNSTLMAFLQQLMPKSTVVSYTEAAFDADAREAVAFAVLGYCTLTNVPCSLPSISGASSEALMGHVTPGSQGFSPLVKLLSTTSQHS